MKRKLDFESWLWARNLRSKDLFSPEYNYLLYEYKMETSWLFRLRNRVRLRCKACLNIIGIKL